LGEGGPAQGSNPQNDSRFFFFFFLSPPPVFLKGKIKEEDETKRESYHFTFPFLLL
jgi:hypothetical protein